MKFSYYSLTLLVLVSFCFSDIIEVDPISTPLNLDEFLQYAESDKSIVILDTRNVEEALKGFIPNSILISTELDSWLDKILLKETRLLLLTSVGQEKNTIINLNKRGFLNILGFLAGGLNTWVNAGRPLNNIENIDIVENIDAVVNSNFSILDVREKSEWIETGVIRNSTLFSLSQFQNNIDDLIASLPQEQNKPLYVTCRSGMRGSIAGSIIMRKGYKSKIIDLFGGVSKLIQSGYKLEAYSGDQFLVDK